MPQRQVSGRPEFAWPECREWREVKIREDARATRHAGGSEEYKLEMAELALRERRAQVDDLEMGVAERRRLTVTVDFMAGEEERLLLAIGARLRSIPPAWSPAISLCGADLVEIELKLRDLVNEMMPMLQRDAEGDEDLESTPVDEDEDLGEATA